MRKLFILPVLFCVICFSNAFPETIELHDGKTLTGDIISETENGVVVSVDGGSFTCAISKDRIKSIKESTPEAKEGTGGSMRQNDASNDETILSKFQRFWAGVARRFTNDMDQAQERTEKLKQYREQRYKEQVASAQKSKTEKENKKADEEKKASCGTGRCPNYFGPD